MIKRLLPLGLFLAFLPSCAMDRAADAQQAQQLLLGKSKEQIFSCMGIPKKKAREAATEVWAYDSGDKRQARSKQKVSSSKNFTDSLTASLGLEDEVRTARYCTVQIVFKQDAVAAVHYSGPTGGFLTEDEQCAYAVRNCLGAKKP